MFLDDFLFAILTFLEVVTTSETDCDKIKCSQVYDPVCGLEEHADGVRDIVVYKNQCFLLKTECEMTPEVVVREIPAKMCGLKETKTPSFGGRRMIDHSIVGGHQACNHTCPTYCVDTYEPACAMIMKPSGSFQTKPMINHCHIDLFSCAFGVNVTVAPLGRCYQNPAGLLFVSQIAALKSLQLLDTAPTEDFAKLSHFKYGAKIYN